MVAGRMGPTVCGVVEELGDCPCGGRTADEQVLAAAMVAALSTTGVGWLNPSNIRALSVAACVALATRTSLPSTVALCCAAAASRAAWALAFFSASLALRPALFTLSRAICSGVSSSLGFFFFGAAERAAMATGMAAAAASFGAVAMAGARGQDRFGERRGKWAHASLTGGPGEGQGPASCMYMLCPSRRKRGPNLGRK